jgi:hypothetical protein
MVRTGAPPPPPSSPSPIAAAAAAACLGVASAKRDKINILLKINESLYIFMPG